MIYFHRQEDFDQQSSAIRRYRIQASNQLSTSTMTEHIEDQLVNILKEEGMVNWES